MSYVQPGSLSAALTNREGFEAAAARAFRRFCDQRDESGARDLITALMALPVGFVFEHLGAFFGQLAVLVEWAEDAGEFSIAQIGQIRQALSMFSAEIANNRHQAFEFHLNCWLFNHGDAHVYAVRQFAREDDKIREFLAANVWTKELAE